MPLSLKDFNYPERHPYDMLAGYRHAFDKETLLALMLMNALTKGDLEMVYSAVHNHSTMVDDGLLQEVGHKQYRLTQKALGLLYSVYGKEEPDERSSAGD